MIVRRSAFATKSCKPCEHVSVCTNPSPPPFQTRFSFRSPESDLLCLSSPAVKNIFVRTRPKSLHIFYRPAPHRGVSRSSRTRSGMRWTRAALLTRAQARGRRSRVVLTPRRWRQVGGGSSAGDGDNKARSPGRARRKPLKPLRAGMPGEPVYPW